MKLFENIKKKIKLSRLRQDKHSQIEFYLIDAFEIFHYLPIYNFFKQRGINCKIVAEPNFTNTTGNWFDYDEAVKILNKLLGKNEYSKLANPDAKIAFTTQRITELKKYKNIKINLLYGFGFLKNDFLIDEGAIKGFDYKLLNGEVQKTICGMLGYSTKLMDIGYPKYEQFIKNTPKREEILKELRIKTDKKILMYYPTYDEENSIGDYCCQLKELKKEYFVVTKAHHCTYRLPDKQGELDMLKECSDVVLEGNYDFARSTLIGDIAVVDGKSGASTEVPYLNPNIKMIISYKSKNDFLDMMFDFAYCIDHTVDLKQAIENIEKQDDFQKYRNEAVGQIYSRENLEILYQELLQYLN